MVGYVGTHGTNPAVRKLPYDAVKDFTPDRDGRRHAERARGAAVAPAKTLAEFVAYAKANPGKLSLRLGRPGHAHPPRDGAAQGGDRPRHGARRVPRHRPGDHRHPRRPDAGAVARARRRTAAHQGRQDAADRGDRHQAPSTAAGRADVRGTGLPGIRRRPVVRHRRPGRHAAGDHAAPQHRDQQASGTSVSRTSAPSSGISPGAAR